MAGENRGTYVYLDGVLVPAATVKGSKGDKGDKGDPGPSTPGAAASGVVVSTTAPANPQPWSTVWLDPSGSFNNPTIHVVGATNEPAYQNSWATYDTTYNGAQYAKLDNGLLVMWGMVKSGTVGQNVFTLPAGFRPSTRLLFNVQSNGAIGRVDILPDGSVLTQGGSNTWLSLAGIVFFAVQ